MLEYAAAILQDEALLDFIAENTYQYYLEQNTETSYTNSLCSALGEVKQSISNLVKALEAGIFNEATKSRMEELDAQKAELESALSAAKLREDLAIKKDHILYFLHQFAVLAYDDKVVLTFNYSGDNRTITLKEIDAGLQQGVRLPRSVFHHLQKATPFWVWLSYCPVSF